jgi:hypothetical protein
MAYCPGHEAKKHRVCSHTAEVRHYCSLYASRRVGLSLRCAPTYVYNSHVQFSHVHLSSDNRVYVFKLVMLRAVSTKKSRKLRFGRFHG